MNGLCTNCQVYFPMPPDFGDGVPYACPQCNALLVQMQETPAPAPEPTPPPPAEPAAPPTAEAAAPPPPVEPEPPAPPAAEAAAPPPPAEPAAPPAAEPAAPPAAEPAAPPAAETAAPPAAETAAPPAVEPAAPPAAETAAPPAVEPAAPPAAEPAAPATSPDDVSTEEVTLPPVTPLDPPPNPAPPSPEAAAPASEAPVSLTPGEDEPESNTLVTAVPDEVKEIMAQKAAAAAPDAGGQLAGPMPGAGTPKAPILWFHPRISPEVEVARSRRPAEAPAPPASSSFSMSGAGNGVAVEDLSGLSIPAAPPEAKHDEMASTIDTRPPELEDEAAAAPAASEEGAAAGPELVDADDIVEVPAPEESSSYVQKGGIRDEMPGAKPKEPPVAAAPAAAEAKPATAKPKGAKPPRSAARPKVTTATVKPIRQGGMGKWVAIAVVGLLGGGAIVAFAAPQLLPTSIREAIHGPDAAVTPETGPENVVAGDEGDTTGADPVAGSEGSTEAAGDPAAEGAEAVAGDGAETGDEAGDEAVAEAGDGAESGDEAGGEAVAEAGDTAEAEQKVEATKAAPPTRVAAAERRGRRGGRRGAREGRRGRTGTETARVTRTGTATTSPKAETPKPAPSADDPRVRAKDHVRAGNSFLKQGKVDQAISQYEKAILLDGRLAAAHRGLGVAYASLGRAREAVREYELYLKLAPKARDAGQVKKIIDQYYSAQKAK